MCSRAFDFLGDLARLRLKNIEQLLLGDAPVHTICKFHFSAEILLLGSDERLCLL